MSPLLLALGAFLTLALPAAAVAIALAQPALRARRRLVAVERLQRELVGATAGARPGAAAGGPPPGGLAARIGQTAAGRWGLARAERDLEQTSWAITPERYLVRRALLYLAAAVLVGWQLRSLPAAVLAVGLAHFVWDRAVAVKAERRRRKIGVQTEQVIEILIANLRAGRSLLQSLTALADEAPLPSREEYGRVVRQLSLGSPVSEALRSLEARVPVEQVSLLVSALNLHHRIGGELPMLLRIAADTIREQVRLQDEVRTAAAGQVLASYVVVALPIVLFGALLLIDRPYISGLLQPGWNLLLVLGGAMEVAGFFIMRSFTKLEL
jgi:tight adherence protein B